MWFPRSRLFRKLPQKRQVTTVSDMDRLLVDSGVSAPAKKTMMDEQRRKRIGFADDVYVDVDVPQLNSSFYAQYRTNSTANSQGH